MSQLEDRVRHLFGVSIESKIAIADVVSPYIVSASQKLVQCLLNEGKILVCGQGGSAANGLHFTTALLNHFEVERPSLPAISLSTDMVFMTDVASVNQYDSVFARQIQAIASSKDILLVLTTAGNSSALIHAVNAANEIGIDTIVLNGQDGGVLSTHLGPEDIDIKVPGDTSALIRENHLFILHCLCDLIDQTLFGQMGGA
jgi:D-sedoheptulose 7-phosphate isomerase